jgi:hypothetical protein
VNDVPVETWVYLLLILEQLHFVNVSVDGPGNLHSQFVKRKIGGDFHRDLAFVDVEVIDNLYCDHLRRKKRVNGRHLVDSVLLRFVHQLFDDFEVFLLLVFSFVELLQTAVEYLGLKLGNRID